MLQPQKMRYRLKIITAHQLNHFNSWLERWQHSPCPSQTCLRVGVCHVQCGAGEPAVQCRVHEDEAPRLKATRLDHQTKSALLTYTPRLGSPFLTLNVFNIVKWDLFSRVSTKLGHGTANWQHCSTHSARNSVFRMICFHTQISLC